MPHSIWAKSDVLVVLSDNDYKKRKTAILDDQFDYPQLSKIIACSKLRKEYVSFEKKRKLYASYDLVLAENKVIELMPKALGSHFYRRKKNAVPIEASTTQSFKNSFKQALNCTFYYKSKGATCTLRIGRQAFTREQLVANTVAALRGLAFYLPHGFTDMVSINLKGSKTPALPFYNVKPVYVKPPPTKSSQLDIPIQLDDFDDDYASEDEAVTIKQKKYPTPPQKNTKDSKNAKAKKIVKQSKQKKRSSPASSRTTSKNAKKQKRSK
mmetsp:Transcript_4142/g.6240  ORF Transcript_4142/g.6240 Transcript_4142/m.6240 type:complete len:268 (+) Transcript_4142:290-1093(+)